MAEPGIKYKFGDSELDLANYIHNLENNVSSYLDHRAKKAQWNDGQIQEFRNAYQRYIDVLKGLLAGSHTRLSTNSLGTIIDTNGELNDTDLDDFYYNSKGEQITGADYNNLRDRKKKKYGDFRANREIAKYWHIIGLGIRAKSELPVGTNKYDQTKHGFKAWWNTVKNPNGGLDLTPYLNLDPFDTTTGKRAVTNRAKLGASFINDANEGYLKWLEDQKLDYTGSPLTFELRKARLNKVATSWGNGVWDPNDLIDAQLAGIEQDWLDGFFTEKENPLTSQADIDAAKAKAEAEAKSAEAKAKAEQTEKDRREWIDLHRKNYMLNRGNYHDDNYGFLVGTLNRYDNIGELDSSFKEGQPDYKYVEMINGKPRVNYDKYQKDWLINPFNQIEAKRAISYMIMTNLALRLEDGTYYIPQMDDEAKGRALLYDPVRGTIRYTFIGNIAPVWNIMKQKYLDSKNPEYIYQRYGEGGELPKLQYGGYFDANAWAEEERRKLYEANGKKSGRDAEKQEAAERIVGAAPGMGEVNGKSADNTWNSEEYARAAGAVGDIISGVSAFVPGYGTAVSAITGLASTGLNLYADIMDDSTSFGDVLKNAAVNLGFDLVGLIPVGGNATSTFGKIAKNSTKIITKGAMILGTMSAFNNREEILNSFAKFKDDPTHLEVQDWLNIAQGLCVAFGITGAAGRKLTLNTYNADNGMPYSRRKATVDQQSVVVEMVNKNTGKKEYRVFSGEDAVKIKEAQASGDNAALRRETVEKFDELKDMDIATGFSGARIRGFHDAEGWHANPIAVKEGKPKIYDIAVGPDGKYVSRGKWTGDVLTTDPQVKKAGKTNALVAQERIDAEDALIKADPDVQAAIAGSQRIDNILAHQSERLAALDTRLKARQLALTDYDVANPTRSTTAILSDIDRINANLSSYSSRLSKYLKRSKIADEVDDTGAIVTKGKATQAVETLVRKRTAILGEIRTKTTELAMAADADKPAILAEIDRLTKERERLFKLQKRAEMARDKAKTDADNDKKWLDDNDASKLPTLNTELTLAQGIETGRLPLQSSIESMKARIDAWRGYNSGTKSDETIKLEGRKNADGTISFTLPGHTEPVVRQWNDVLSKFAITHRRGGAILKFLEGGISNIKGNIDWYADMFNSPEMLEYLNTNFSDADLDKFNSLLKSWRKNLTTTGYDPNNPEKAKGGTETGLVSAGVYGRLTLWHALNKGALNAPFTRMYTEGKLIRSGKGQGDSADGNWRDGWFGTLEYVRHFGSAEQWKGHETELASAQKKFAERGLKYELDPESQMYLLSRATAADLAAQASPESVTTEPQTVTEPAVTLPAAKTGNPGQTTVSTEHDPESTNTTNRDGQGFMLDPDTLNLLKYSIPRNIIANRYNDIMIDLAKDNERNLFLENPEEHYKQVFSSLADEMAGIRLKAELLRLAQSKPLTSDGGLQLAVTLEAAVKGLAAEEAGRKESSKIYRATQELADQARATSKASIHKVAEANRETLVEARRKINELEQMRLSKKHTNDDVVAQLAEFNAKNRQAGEEAFVRSDIHNAVYYDLKKYAPEITDALLAAWNKALAGVSYSDMTAQEQNDYMIAARLAQLAEQDLYRMYKGYSNSRWSGVRLLAANTPESEDYTTLTIEDIEAFNKANGIKIVKTEKKGGTVGEKIEVQKLRNKAKDQDRFHKNALKHLDRNEKALDRCSRHSRTRRT